MLDVDALRHDIDCRTPDVPPMTRQDVVTWCLINYMAGSRDLFTPAADGLPWDRFADDQLGVLGRRAVAAELSGMIDQLLATVSTGPHPGAP